MISRRKARIKALQALYMGQVYDSEHNVDNASELKEQFSKSLQQTADGVYAVLWFIKRVNEYADIAVDNARQKLDQDHQVDERPLKLLSLELVQQLNDSPSFRKKTDALHMSSEVDVDLIKKLYRNYVSLPEVQQYLESDDESIEAQHTILLHLLQDVLLANDSFQDFMEQKFSLWYDDETEVVIIVSRIIESGLENVNLDSLIIPDVIKLGNTLIDASISKRDYYDELIQPKLNNWDAKRIAHIDMLLLYMGLTEFLYMPTIPTIVTINEYIDIVKQYGAEQSKQFINAVLDNLKLQLTEENLISKES